MNVREAARKTNELLTERPRRRSFATPFRPCALLYTTAVLSNNAACVCMRMCVRLLKGENDRVGLLHTLATLEEHPESVPINALVPVDGTPLAGEGKADAPDIWDMGRMIATARVVMPRTMVRLSAGRLSFSEAEQVSRRKQAPAPRLGPDVNSVLVFNSTWPHLPSCRV